MVRRSARCARVNVPGTTCPHESAQPIDSPCDGARRTSVRWPPASHRTRSPPAEADRGDRSRQESPAGDAAADCASPPDPGRDRSRTPLGASSTRVAGTMCTTASNVGSAPPPAPSAGRSAGGGSDRSSRQTQTALGATRLEHRTPGAGAHARTEAVLLGTTMVVGLERTLHGVSPRTIGLAGNGTDNGSQTRPHKARGARGDGTTRRPGPRSRRFLAPVDSATVLRLSACIGVVHRCGQPCGCGSENRVPEALPSDRSRLDD